MNELVRLTAQLAEAKRKVETLRKQRDKLITELTQPPHNHTYQAIADVLGVTRQAVAQIKAKGQQT